MYFLNLGEKGLIWDLRTWGRFVHYYQTWITRETPRFSRYVREGNMPLVTKNNEKHNIN